MKISKVAFLFPLFLAAYSCRQSISQDLRDEVPGSAINSTSDQELDSPDADMASAMQLTKTNSVYTVIIPNTDVTKLKNLGYAFFRIRQLCRSPLGVGSFQNTNVRDFNTPNTKTTSNSTYSGLGALPCATQTKEVACGVNIEFLDKTGKSLAFCGMNSHLTPNKDPNDTFCRTDKINSAIFSNISRYNNNAAVSMNYTLSTVNKACPVYLKP